jgi:hypothetical protein
MVCLKGLLEGWHQAHRAIKALNDKYNKGVTDVNTSTRTDDQLSKL